VPGGAATNKATHARRDFLSPFEKKGALLNDRGRGDLSGSVGGIIREEHAVTAQGRA